MKNHFTIPCYGFCCDISLSVNYSEMLVCSFARARITNIACNHRSRGEFKHEAQ